MVSTVSESTVDVMVDFAKSCSAFFLDLSIFKAEKVTADFINKLPLLLGV